MIRRTVLEWGSLPYGDGPDCIPHRAADRLAAVAAASPLGGKDGARILSQGKKQIRAGQIVGVLAAHDCALEILPKIDFATEKETEGAIGQTRKQLVHMLAVAMDLRIATGQTTDLGWQRENLLEILIGLYARKLADVIRQGMPRSYIEREDDLPVIRGRLNVARQFTTLVVTPQKLACRYDSLSPDIALNQIMKAAVARLSKVSRSNENQRRLRELTFAFADIADVPLAALPWHSVVLNRANARWHELLNLAKLLLGNRFQTTSHGEGRGFSLLFEMNTLFQEYIARLLMRAHAGTELQVQAQGGRLYCLKDLESGVQRFMTKPDVLVKRNATVELIVDTKWKRLSAQVDDAKQGVSQPDIYQMMAYGQIYGCQRLMLLYPHHAALGVQAGVLANHQVRGTDDHLTIASIDVSNNDGILDRLRQLMACGGQA